MPVLSTIIGLGIAAASAGAGISGAVSAHGQEKTQQQALKDENAIAQQEMTDKQKIFQQLTDFFTPYTKSGSPFLANIQRASAEQNAQQADNAAGKFRSEVGPTGFGFGPSGTTAAGLAGIGSGVASSSASDYLTNLLNNEQVKFQAASGLNSAGSMVGSPQNQPNVGTTLPPASTASSVGALGNVFKTLGAGTGTTPTSPIPGTNVNTIDFGAAPVSGTIP